jgi:hypothetical protein
MSFEMLGTRRGGKEGGWLGQPGWSGISYIAFALCAWVLADTPGMLWARHSSCFGEKHCQTSSKTSSTRAERGCVLPRWPSWCSLRSCCTHSGDSGLALLWTSVRLLVLHSLHLGTKHRQTLSATPGTWEERWRVGTEGRGNGKGRRSQTKCNGVTCYARAALSPFLFDVFPLSLSLSLPSLSL